MTPEFVLSIGSESLQMALMVAAPMLAVGLTVGIVISLFQAVTQIHEVSLAFIPKIVAMVLSLLMFASWMLTKLIDFSTYLFQQIPNMVQ